jgi:hypothetical protein
VRAALAARFAGKPKIRVIAPEDATALGACCIRSCNILRQTRREGCSYFFIAY